VKLVEAVGEMKEGKKEVEVIMGGDGDRVRCWEDRNVQTLFITYQHQ